MTHNGFVALTLIVALTGCWADVGDPAPSEGGSEGSTSDAGTDTTQEGLTPDLGGTGVTDTTGGGPDRAADGSYLIYTGDFLITDELDVADFAIYGAITGNLTIRSADMRSLELPYLTSVGGILRVAGNEYLTELSLPKLRTVSRDLVVSNNTRIVELDGLPALARVGRDLAISSNHSLESVVLPMLATVDGNLSIGSSLDEAHNRALTRVTMDSLTVVEGALLIINNRKLETLELELVEHTHGLYVTDNRFLPRLSLGALTSVDGSLTVRENADLAAWNLSRLSSLNGGFTVTDNRMLPTCRAESVLGRLRGEGFGGAAHIERNDNDARCDDLCSPVGSEGGDGVCLADGTRAPACQRSDCLTENRLCQLDPSNSRFNQCVTPGSVTAQCGAAGGFEGGRVDEGPVVFDLTYGPDSELDADCDAIESGTLAYSVSLTYQDLEGDMHFEAGSDAEAGVTWVLPADEPTDDVPEPPAPTVESGPAALAFDSADGTRGRLTFTLCDAESVPHRAVQIHDSAGHRSNVGCVWQ